MTINLRNTDLIRVLIAAIMTLTFLPELEAQAYTPGQLRNEVLQYQKNQQPKPAAPANRRGGKAPAYQPPPVGTTVFKPANPAKYPKSSLIYLENSDALFFDQVMFPDIQVLKGNVRFRHENAVLHCDSAYFNDVNNTFDAFGRIKMVQGDTLFIYGDYLNYDGNTRLARLRDNVKMVNRNTTLTTDSMNYDRTANLAYYYTGGKVVDDVNVLTSVWGQYSPATRQALFKDDVKMTNPNFTLTSDTLKYNTKTSIADIVGDSHVLYEEKTNIYSKLGWYDTAKDRMMLLDRSFVEQNDGKTLVGDTIFYDKKNKYSEAFSNVELNDPKQKTTLYGNFVSYDEAKEKGLATDSALLIDWSGKDSLFLSADTLYNFKDSIYDAVKAQKNVRFFRVDVQGMCDSLFYTSRDSIMHLTALPVLWSDNNQLMGDKISAFTKNKKVEKIYIDQSAMAIQKDTLDYYNQLSGKEITAYLDSNQLRRVDVDGNAETIYFPRDEKTREIIGLNKTVSSYVRMYLKDKKVERIILTTASSGSMYPIIDLAENDLYLRNFYWYETERPSKMEDVFLKFARTAPPKRTESEKKPGFPTEGGEETDKQAKQTTDRNANNSVNRNTNNSSNRNTGRQSINTQRSRGSNIKIQ